MIFTTSYNPHHYYSSPWISLDEAAPRRRNSCRRNARRYHGFPVAAEQPDFVSSLLFMKLLSETLDNEQQPKEEKNEDSSNNAQAATTSKSEEEKSDNNEKNQPATDQDYKATSSTQRIINQRPIVNVHEDEEKVVLSLDVPGYDMNGLEIMLTNNDTVLVVSGEKINKLSDDNEKYVFRRRFRVNPLNLKKNRETGAPVIVAGLSLGVLTITIQKDNKPREARTIEINVQQQDTTTAKTAVTSDEAEVASNTAGAENENESTSAEETSIDVDAEQTSLAPEDVVIETVPELDEDEEEEDAASVEAADESTTKNESDEWEEVIQA